MAGKRTAPGEVQAHQRHIIRQVGRQEIFLAEDLLLYATDLRVKDGA